MDVKRSEIGVVIIGRNEGARLRACLASIPAGPRRVYVDSGSTDGSLALARSMGFQALSLAAPFTAARGRNLGASWLARNYPDLRFLQMLDGDCVLAQGWLEVASAALATDRQVAVVFGRRRERYPNASAYNMACDDEWNVPLGEARSCGGDAMFVMSALLAAGGYRGALIAGEEPDLCLRLRARGWRIVRLDAEMSLHDAALLRFSQYWTRARRSGHAYAELVQLHGRRSNADWSRELLSFFAWSSLMIVAIAGGLAALALQAPGVALLLALAPWALFVAQGVRMTLRRMRDGLSAKHALQWSFLNLAGKFAQAYGALQFHLRARTSTPSTLIEYKA